LVSVAAILAAFLCTAQTGGDRLDLAGEWPVFRGNVDWSVNRREPNGNQFAALAQINATNKRYVDGGRSSVIDHAVVILDRPPHHFTTINIQVQSYRI
jgi:hypothetical protein